MKRPRCLLVFIIVFLLAPAKIYAKQSDEFLFQLSDKIYDDCRGKDLLIKESSLIDLRSSPTALITLNAEAKKWPNYNARLIFELLQIFTSREPYGVFHTVNGKKIFTGFIPQIQLILGNGAERAFINYGDDLLKCENKALDINGSDYLWNNEKFSLLKSPITIVQTKNEGFLFKYLFNNIFEFDLISTSVIPVSVIPISLVVYLKRRWLKSKIARILKYISMLNK